jgi:DNA repair exonuclease SbcCD ATPase subunit
VTLDREHDALTKASGEYQQLDKKLKPLVQQEKPNLDAKAAKLLKRELSREDDPVALLKREEERIRERLEQLKTLIEDRQRPLTQSEGELAKLRCVREVLQKTDQQRIIEQVKESPAKKELDQERDRLAVFVNDVEAIKQAVAAASNSEADEKLKAAGRAIDDYFRRLARNPAIKQIILERKEDAQKGLNVYKITDQSGQDLTPLLSQGDLNALAMAIFLGLASAGGTTAPLGFVMLDDPSQSMGAEHKENLASVLDEVSHSRHVLLATMDGEFYTCLSKGLTRAKSVYMFDGWTPSAGPSVRLQ